MADPTQKAPSEQTYRQNRAEAAALLQQVYPQAQKLPSLNQAITQFRRDNKLADIPGNEDAQMAQTVTALRARAAELKATAAPAQAAPAQAGPASPAPNKPEAATTTAPVAKNPQFDPEVQKLQGYMRGLGITEVEVNGEKKPLNVDGVNGPITSAAMAKYKASNGLDNNDGFASVMKHMEDRLKQNPADVQQRMAQTAAQGPGANPMNVMAMQLILNLLAPLINKLTGGKINLEQLKVDGINGPKTTNNFNGYQAAPAVTAKPEVKPEVKPAGAEPAAPQAPAGGGLKVDAAQPAKPEATAARSERTYAEQTPNGGTTTVRPDDYEAQRAAAPAQVARPQRYEGPATTYAPVRAQFSAMSGQDQLNRTLGERAELRAQGYAPSVAKQLVEQNRMGELVSQGMDDRSAKRQVGMESRMADMQERGMQQTDRQFAAADRRAEQQMRRDGQTLGRDISILGGASSREARAIGNIAGVAGGVLSRMGGIGGDSSVGMDARTARQMSRDASTVTRDVGALSGMNSREARAIGNIAGVIAPRVIEYPQPQQRGGYVETGRAQGFSLDRSNQISGEYREVSTRGATAEQRLEIMHAQQMQQGAPAIQTADNTGQNRQRQLDNFSPGG